MSEKCNDNTILCECGHPLIWHSFAHQCNASTRRTERRKNHLGKYVKVKCVYVCHCKEFKQTLAHKSELKGALLE